MRIKLSDVAVRAGVSEATVSRVMNARPGVSPTTRAAVLAVMSDLGYEPTTLRAPARGGFVGLVVPELDNPIFPAFAQAIEARLVSRGFVSVLCCAARTGATEDDYVPTLLEHGTAGIVVVSGRHADTEADHELYRDLHRRRVPLVLVNGAIPGLDVAAVSSDEHAAASIAVAHLAHLGHRRVGFLTGPPAYLPVQRRLAGFRAAVRAHGLDRDDELVVPSMFSVTGGHVGAQRLLEQGATGIVAASDVMALGAVRAVREAGLDVPGDVSVVGYDDTDLMAFTDPPLTTVHQAVGVISEHTVQVLVAQIAGQPYPTSEYLVRPELVVRGSTGPARVGAAV